MSIFLGLLSIAININVTWGEKYLFQFAIVVIHERKSGQALSKGHGSIPLTGLLILT